MQPEVLNLLLPMHTKRIFFKLSQLNQLVNGALHAQQAPQELVVYPTSTLGTMLLTA